MRTSIFAVALVLAMTGCATVVGPEQTITLGPTKVTVAGTDGFNAGALRVPDPNAPNVWVNNNGLVVDQEPLRPLDLNRQVMIVWRLDASDSSPYYFPDDDAIKLQELLPHNQLPAGLVCGTVSPKKKVFVCLYTRPGQPRQWKYSIRVKNRTGGDLITLDPWIHQP